MHQKGSGKCVASLIFFDKVLYHATMYINEEIHSFIYLFLVIESSF